MREYRHPQITEVQLESVLYALSDPIRLSIVRQLAREGEASCAALENGRPKSSVSHHFRVLREAGIIKTRNDGTSRINELRDDELAEVFPGLLPAILAVRI